MSTHVTFRAEFRLLMDAEGRTRIWPAGWTGGIEDDGIAAYVLAAGVATPTREIGRDVSELVQAMREIIDEQRDRTGTVATFTDVAVAIQRHLAQADSQPPPAPHAPAPAATDAPKPRSRRRS